MHSITAVIVSFNRVELLQRAYESIRKFSDMPVIIVEGSDPTNECYAYAQSIAAYNTEIIIAGKNIGHGKGMHVGIGKAMTKYVLLMDSDAQIINGDVIQDMMSLLGPNDFGIGQVVPVNPDGTNVGEDYPDFIPYLHPHFAIIDRGIYMMIPNFVHHGAPCIHTMEYLNNFKKFGLVDFPVSQYVNHEGRGTRSLNPEGFLKGWE